MSLFSTLPNNVFIEASHRFSKSITLDKGRSEIYSWLKQLTFTCQSITFN